MENFPFNYDLETSLINCASFEDLMKIGEL